MARSDPSIPRVGEADLLRSTRGDSDRATPDPAVTAAFLAFHREQTPALFAPPMPRNRLGVGGWIYIALVLCGVAGTLFLASIPIYQPETSSTAAARPPEMMYLPPAESAERALPVVKTASRAETVVARVEEAPATSSTEPQQAAFDATLAGFEPWSVASLANMKLPEATANFNVAMRHHAAGYSLGPASSDGVESAYAGVELPSVPEPAAAPIVCAGLALLLGVAHLKKRRS